MSLNKTNVPCYLKDEETKLIINKKAGVKARLHVPYKNSYPTILLWSVQLINTFS